MANNKRKDDKERIVTPFTDPNFRRRSVSFDDIEFQRKFEQNLIRYNIIKQAETEVVPPAESSGNGATADSGTAMTAPPYDEGQVMAGSGLWSDIAGAGGMISIGSVVSATTRNSNDTEKSTAATSLTKIKEIRLDEDANALRIYYSLRTSNASYTAYGHLYLNGVALGTIAETNDTVGYAVEEDFAQEFVAGDLIQIYAYSEGGGSTAYVKNMRLKYDRAISKIGDWTLATGLPTVEQTAYLTTNQDP